MPRGRSFTYKTHHFAVYEAVNGNPPLLDLLVIAVSPAQKSFFIQALVGLCPDAFGTHSEQPGADRFIIFTSTFGRYKPESSTQFTGIATALNIRQQCFVQNHQDKRSFITAIGLDCTPSERDLFLGKVETISLSKLVSHYVLFLSTCTDPMINLSGQVEVLLPSKVSLDG